MRRREFIAGLGSAVTWPSLALVAATSGALVVGITHWRHEPPVEARPVSISPSGGVKDQGFPTAKPDKTIWRRYSPFRLARRTPASLSSTLPALRYRVTRSSLAGLHLARVW